jgi:DNA-directed RNA polymerase subunit H (RpoH/RPB5)
MKNIFKSRNIILDLLEKRGYNVSDYNNRSFGEVQNMYSDKQLDMLLEHKTEKVNVVDFNDDGVTERNKKCLVKYHLQGKIRINQIYEYIDDIYHIEDILTKDDDFIIIVKDKPNDTLLKLMNTIWNVDSVYFGIYNLNNYLYNILDHELVPSHRILSNEEYKEIYKKYKIINTNQFPEISRFDPVAQAIGLRPDQLCEIIRNSPTAIKTIYYRLCN